MIKTKSISNSKPRISISTTENTFLYINNIRLLGNNKDFFKYAKDIEIKSEFVYFNKDSISKGHICSLNMIENFKDTDYNLPLNKTISNEGTANLKKINIVLNNKTEFDEFEIEISYSRINYIDIQNPFNNFKNHLKESFNSKILFSAPFGQGKTTFLNKFFEDNKEDYEVFHIYPVNYSVAQNEDIFQYIKVELLLQLFGKDVEFDKIDFSKTLTAFEFAKNHFDEIMLPFARLIPKVGNSIHGFIKDFIKLKKNFDKYNEDINIDDKAEAESFIKSYYEKEGSLFEDNFFTQLIRQLVKQLSTIKKQTILIVDDIDRMDPEHIFRILNVFAAHFDSNDKDEEGSNKFGFDKIVLVCDYSNLRHIFRHKYGEKTDYEGYIDKFFSRSIYEFNNNDAVKYLINDLNNHIDSYFFYTVVNDLLKTNNISLRALYKLEKLLSKDYIYQEKLQLYRHNEQILSIFALTQIMGSESLIDRLKNCKEKLNLKEETHYKNLTANCFISLYNSTVSPSTYMYNNIIYSFSISYQGNQQDYLGVNNINASNIKGGTEEVRKENLPFTHHDFYELVIQIIKKYKTIFEN